MTTEELRALLARLNGEGEALTDAELDSLNAALLARADELLDGESTPEVIAELEGIATAKDAAKEQVDKRAADKAEADKARADLISRIKGSEQAETDETPEAEAVTEEPAVEAAPVAEAPAEVPAEEPVPVAAAAQPRRVNLAAMNAAKPRSADPKPQQTEGLRARAVLKAVEGGRGIRQGDEIPSLEALSNLMSERLRTGTRGDLKIATLETSYPEERLLHEKASAAENQAKIDAAFGAQGLVASGGICAPVAVDYSVPVFGASTVRTLRDALPRFAADRGGIRYITPPTYSTPAGAVGIWTQSVDASPGTATKALYSIVCASENVVYVDAITTRLKVGNMQGRFAPELVAANTQYALSNAARTAELSLWSKINAASVAVTAAATLGAFRDILEEVDRLATAMRYRYRMDPNQQLRVLFPEFMRGLIRTDIAREQAHDNSGSYNALAITDQQMDAWFGLRGINATYIGDPLPAASVTGTGGYAYGLQGFAAQTAGVMNAWPVSATWNMFAEGAFQFLDGGALDLGVVRDSTLDATNDYETFVETFEGLAYRGVEAFQVVSTLNPSGASGRVA